MLMPPRQALIRLALAGLACHFTLPALATEECAQLFSKLAPTKQTFVISPGEATSVNTQLERNNRVNRHVHSVAILRDEAASDVIYTVLNGDAAPIYKGKEIQALAEAIEDASATTGAESVFISLAGFSQTKAAGMRSTMNMQWAHLGAKPRLLVRMPHDEQSWIDVALPQAFYLPHTEMSKVTKITSTRLVHGAGNQKWYEVIVEFAVKVGTAVKRFSVSVVVRTKDMQRQVEKMMIKLHPDWLASHASAAEVVSQVMAQMTHLNPKMRSDNFRIEILDQVDGNRFVKENPARPSRDVRYG